MRIIYESKAFYSYSEQEAVKYYVVVTETSDDIDNVKSYLSDPLFTVYAFIKSLNLGFNDRIDTAYAEDGEIVDETHHWYSVVEATTEAIIVKEHIVPTDR